MDVYVIMDGDTIFGIFSSEENATNIRDIERGRDNYGVELYKVRLDTSDVTRNWKQLYYSCYEVRYCFKLKEWLRTPMNFTCRHSVTLNSPKMYIDHFSIHNEASTYVTMFTEEPDTAKDIIINFLKNDYPDYYALLEQYENDTVFLVYSNGSIASVCRTYDIAKALAAELESRGESTNITKRPINDTPTITNSWHGKNVWNVSFKNGMYQARRSPSTTPLDGIRQINGGISLDIVAKDDITAIQTAQNIIRELQP